MTRATPCIALAAALAIAGCATRTEYVTAELPKPGRPELPSIPGEQLQCISDDAYTALITRERRLREYAEQLEAVIESTHSEGSED